MQRRQFLKDSCGACMAVAGMGLLFSSCAAPLPMVQTPTEGDGSIIRVPQSNFNDKTTMLLVRNKKLAEDILLIKVPEGYRALYMRCTHEGVSLTATATKIHCSAHGSVFDMEGSVLKEPALRPLRKFKTETNNTDVLIHLS